MLKLIRNAVLYFVLFEPNLKLVIKTDNSESSPNSAILTGWCANLIK